VAFDHDISITTMLPAGSNPHCARTRRRFPSAGLPGIGIAVPAMISAYPDMLTTRPYATLLNKEPWRRDSYHYFRCLDDAGSYNNRE
jgi:hypothetical protein